MELHIDTRQQVDKHTEKEMYFASVGVPFYFHKLDVGDYAFYNEETKEYGNIAVDTKQDMNELASNLTNHHIRFRNACILARDMGIQLIILTEEYQTPESIKSWFRQTITTKKCEETGEEKIQKHRAILGQNLFNIMVTMNKKYGVKFRFCRRCETASKILNYLTQ